MTIIQSRGIALVQVLIITAVLSVLALYFSQTARLQVYQARSAVEQAQAIINLHDTEAKLLFALLTEDKNPNLEAQQKINHPFMMWNFYGVPFEFKNGITITLQDLRGVLNLHYPESQRLKGLLTFYGLSNYDADLLTNKILDWQDTDQRSRYGLAEQAYRNGAVQDASELMHLDIPSELLTELSNNTTIYKKGGFNPMNSPEFLLRSILAPEVAEHVLRLRKNKQLTPQLFSQLTGIFDSEKVILYPSNMFVAQINSQVGNARVIKKVTWQLEPTKGQPVNVAAVENQ
ncbi:general secretion pathway protein GspK [Pseudoalteromonas ulvae]|uniref:general secretion pathway protein GspK n=1 Tax=Pseudoalteromonas ulvae TaxID=107327 RepID=UPI001593AE73|nr:type II secretion system protein GspK [Pseudoalteromonas ulvae]